MLLTKYAFVVNSKSLVDRSLANIFEHLYNAGYSKEVAQNICNPTFIESNPDYYLYYPYLFNSVFNFYDDKVLDSLSIAGFLFYRSILFMDDIFDTKGKNGSFNDFLMANVCQEETIKILSSHFDLNSPFWTAWNKRKFEYAKAYELDKLSHKIFSFQQYVTLCDYKSTFGKVAIDAIFTLVGKNYELEYQKILESHKNFYVAFQILDDISDYEEDDTNNQFNISKYYLKKTTKNLESLNLQDQKKHLYLDNVAGKLYSKALSHIRKSINILRDYELPIWQSELQTMHNTIISHNLNVDGFIRFATGKINKSIPAKEKYSIEKSIEMAGQYLVEIKESNGSWIDYFNDAGTSNVWTTSFVSYFLSIGVNPKFDLIKSKKFILANRVENKNIWGYNSQWIPDADSTSFALLSLHALGVTFNKDNLEEWFKFQNKDGGFCTYRNEGELLISLNSKNIQNVQGWMKSHFCVSSVAYLVVCKLGISNANTKKLESYILKEIQKNDHSTYWWTSNIYPISFLILACCSKMNNEIFDLCNALLKKMSGGSNIVPKNEFYAGLLLLSIVKSKQYFEYSAIFEKSLVHYLAAAQNQDGSWKENHSMRIPSPEIVDPENQVANWAIDNKGTNIVLQDFNRVFTTTVCLTALQLHYSQ